MITVFKTIDFMNMKKGVHLKNPEEILGEWDSVLIDKANIYNQINKLRQANKYDIYFNLCYDSLEGN